MLRLFDNDVSTTDYEQNRKMSMNGQQVTEGWCGLSEYFIPAIVWKPLRKNKKNIRQNSW
jgi:hypothetical protein